MKLSDYVIKFIENLGTKHVFMVSGGGCMHLVDSIGKSEKITYICNGNEQAVTIAVESYAQYNNQLGVGLVTTGPGGTNALTGVAAGYVDSTPMMIISGQVKTSDFASNVGVRQFGFQEIDIVSMATPVTKYAVTVTKADEIRYHLEKAVYLAKNGRPGPVWVDIPLDIQGAEIEPNKQVGYIPESFEYKDIQEEIESIIDLIDQSSRPCILAGNGIRLSGMVDQFTELVDLLNVPVLLTWKAIDYLDHDHPLNYGRPGSIGQRCANIVQQKSDLLIVIGARLDLGQTAYNHQNFAPEAIKIMVDIDQKEIDKLDMTIEYPINTTAKIFIDGLMKGIQEKEIDLKKKWLNYCRDLKKMFPLIPKKFWEKDDYVDYYCFIDALSNRLDNSALIVPGSSGSCSEATMQSFRVKKGQRVYNNQGLGSMGFGLPAGIAASLASDEQVVVIEGDGGFQFNIQELETLKRLNLPVKIFIFNNQGYGAITNMQRNHFESHYVASEKNSGVTIPDVLKVSEAFGIKATRVWKNSELIDKINQVIDYDGPIVCDLMIDPMQITLFRTKSVRLENGMMETKPMEDLWPFLDAEILKKL